MTAAPEDQTSPSNESAPPPAALPPEPDSQTPPPPASSLFKRTPLLIGGALVAALVIAGVLLARRQLDKAPAAEAPAAPVEEISLTPTGAREDEDAGTPLAGETPAPSKIFNSLSETAKAGAEALERTGATTADGAINDLPLPPPPADGGANLSLQDAAKEAAKLFEPQKDSPAEIDLSSPDAGAALERLQSAPEDAPLRSDAAAESAAGAAEIGRLSGALDAERQHAEEQAAEIGRLSAELAALKAKGSPAERQSQAALILLDIADKARAGAPFAAELEKYESLVGKPAPAALRRGAASGLPAFSVLREKFPQARDDALAAARRETATGIASKLSANFASLVRLRRSEATQGAGPSAIFSRAEDYLAAGDLAAALEELDALTGAGEIAASGWTAKAKSLVDAEAALGDMRRALAADIEAGRS